MKIFIIVLCILASIVVISCKQSITKDTKIPDDAILVDVRTPGEFKDGNVPNSINIPLDQVEGSLDKFKSMDKPIVMFCRSGNRSGKAIKILNAHGIENVTNGGGWKDVLKATGKDQ